MPLKVSVAPDGKSMLIVTGGFHDHSIDVIDPAKAVLRQNIPLGKAWAGLAVDRDRGEIYVSGGGPPPEDLSKNVELMEVAPDVKEAFNRPILGMRWSGEAVAFDQSIAITGLGEKNRFIAGLATDSKGHLFVANIQTNTLYELDATDHHVIGFADVGRHPFQVAVSPDETTLAVGNWGDQSVSLLNISTLKEDASVPVGVHPTDLAFAHDGRLFVANASSNSISVIRDNRVIETIMTSLRPNDAIGSTPNALAVSADGSRLYVANADNNDVAVIDVHQPGRSSILGFIPTGWYPSSLALTPDGTQLIVGVAKGIDSNANWPHQDARHKPIAQELNSQPFDYLPMQMTGYAEIIRVPDAKELAAYTHQAESNSPVGDREITAQERRDGEAAFRNIKHVLYIIRENHTYDQNLGDDPRGDGRKDLAYCGESMTPNLHALVRQTPLLDHFFVNGEVSEDGHYWANSAYSTAFNERQTATMYGGRGAPGPDDPDETQDLLHSPAGYLWEVAKRAGLSYFSYGEFGEKPNEALMVTDDKDIHGHTSADWSYIFDKTDAERAKIFARGI